jgi:hypothetical protein
MNYENVGVTVRVVESPNHLLPLHLDEFNIFGFVLNYSHSLGLDTFIRF